MPALRVTNFNQMEKIYKLGNPVLPMLLRVTPAVYPRFVLKYDFSYFSQYKSDPLNQGKNSLMVLPSSPNQNLRQIGDGMGDGIGETNRDY